MKKRKQLQLNVWEEVSEAKYFLKERDLNWQVHRVLYSDWVVNISWKMLLSAAAAPTTPPSDV